MLSDTISITELRERSAALRAQADEIDSVIASLARLMEQASQRGPFIRAAVVSAAGIKPAAYGGGGSVVATRNGVNRGKAPGTLNMSWRANFARIADVSGQDEFPLDLVRDVITERTGNEVKLSAIRRQFNGYIDHGYVTSDAPDRYRLTDKLLRLIRWQPSSDQGRDENGAPEGAPDAEEVSASSNDAQDDIEVALG